MLYSRWQQLREQERLTKLQQLLAIRIISRAWRESRRKYLTRNITKLVNEEKDRAMRYMIMDDLLFKKQMEQRHLEELWESKCFMLREKKVQQMIDNNNNNDQQRNRIYSNSCKVGSQQTSPQKADVMKARIQRPVGVHDDSKQSKVVSFGIGSSATSASDSSRPRPEVGSQAVTVTGTGSVTASDLTSPLTAPLVMDSTQVDSTNKKSKKQKLPKLVKSRREIVVPSHLSTLGDINKFKSLQESAALLSSSNTRTSPMKINWNSTEFEFHRPDLAPFSSQVLSLSYWQLFLSLLLFLYLFVCFNDFLASWDALVICLWNYV